MKIYHSILEVKVRTIILFASIFCVVNTSNAQISYPGEIPGNASIKKSDLSGAILENNVLRMNIAIDDGKLYISAFEDKITGEKLTLKVPLFELKLQDNRMISSDDFALIAQPVMAGVKGNSKATAFAERMPGEKYSADLENADLGIKMHWEAELRDGSNYVRQKFILTSSDINKISRVTLVKLPSGIGFRKEGTVDGSPLVHNTMFFALEYPLSRIEEIDEEIISFFPGMMNTLSTAWGVTPANQLRRGFLYYVERERIHPYHQNLHYNSWYDISFSGKLLTESECLDRIKVFGDSLIKKRKVHMNAFLIDDGWDEHTTLWDFHSGFPEGFANLKKAVRSYNTDIGVWLSPFGGYGKEKDMRIEYGKKQAPPFETNGSGFSLAGPVYFERFREVTGNFIKNYDVYMFKFDGVGAGSGAEAVYQRDVEAFLRLLNDLLKMKPKLYLSLTTGTWPSVYWLKFGDNIWRGGHDTYMTGEGSNRQKWITYRDADTYANVVKRGPFYPLNALMTCGICIGDYGIPAKFEINDKDIADEIWSFFASGTNLQELYVNPHKLNTANWDCLAEAAKWSKDNEKVMTDVHWVGGDPYKGEIYGYAAWSPEKAVLSLRNPSSQVKTFEVNVSQVFELPANVKDEFTFYDAISAGRNSEKAEIAKGSSFRLTLQPFEVKVMDAFNLKSLSRK